MQSALLMRWSDFSANVLSDLEQQQQVCEVIADLQPIADFVIQSGSDGELGAATQLFAVRRRRRRRDAKPPPLLFALFIVTDIHCVSLALLVCVCICVCVCACVCSWCAPESRRFFRSQRPSSMCVSYFVALGETCVFAERTCKQYIPPC